MNRQNRRRGRNFASRQQQSGVVLYIALIMLLILSLLGIVAMQVATLQERMAANYQASALAFQNAEALARTRENQIRTQVNAGTLPATQLPPRECNTPSDPYSWNSTTPYVRRLDLCFSWGSLDLPQDEAEKTDQIYQITAYQTDGNGNSQSVVDTVFIP